MKYVMKALFGSRAWIMLLGKVVCEGVSTWMEASLLLLLPEVIKTGEAFPKKEFLLYGCIIIICRFIAVACRNYRHTVATKITSLLIETAATDDINFHTMYGGDSIQSAKENIFPFTGIIESLVTIITALLNVSIYTYRILSEIPNFGYCMLVLYIVLVVITLLTNVPYQRYEKLAVEVKKNRNRLFGELANGFLLIFMLPGKLEDIKNKLLIDNALTEKMFRRRDIVNALSMSLFSLLYYIGIYLLFQYSTAMSLLLIIGWYGQVIDMIISIILTIPEIASYKAAVSVLLEILAYNNITTNSDDAVRINSFNSEIKIESLSFGYGDSDSVLQDISMKIHKGTKVGIVGASGGGKSTLLKILCGFYNYNGSISIDGIELSDIDNRSIGNIVGYIPQDPAIFNGTIKYNILYGTEGIDDVRLVEACKKANIYEFIINTNAGFETNVGPNGLKLSGGQKQRLALARMFLRNPQVLLLDEATSALDNISEKKVTDTLAASDATVIQVAHRLTTVKGCDCIYVIDNHTVVEYGTHDELLRKEGLYYKLWNQQITE